MPRYKRSLILDAIDHVTAERAIMIGNFAQMRDESSHRKITELYEKLRNAYSTGTVIDEPQIDLRTYITSGWAEKEYPTSKGDNK